MGECLGRGHSGFVVVAEPETYLQANNADPRPFIWTASAEAILAKVRRGRVALAQIPN